MNYGAFEFPQSRVWVFPGDRVGSTNISAVFAAPSSGWYLITGCGAGGCGTGTTGGGCGAMVYRQPVYLVGGQLHQLTIGAYVDNAAGGNGWPTIFGELFTLGGGRGTGERGEITFDQQLFTAANIAASAKTGDAKGGGPGFGPEIGLYPILGPGTPGTNSTNGTAYGAGGGTAGVSAPGLLIIEKAD